MTFNKVFRGYDPQEVDEYIQSQAQKDSKIRAEQKERIDQLLDENATLTQQVKQYQTDEQAISKSLIETQRLVQEMKGDAQKYSDLVLSRAKIFYAAWHTYSQTLISTLSDEEVKEFNALLSKLENVINAYEGKNVQADAENYTKLSQGAVATTVQYEVTPSGATMNVKNPISRVENAVEHAIDLRELTKPKDDLADICKDLGLSLDEE